MIGSDAYNYINVLNKAASASWTKNEIIANNLANAATIGYKKEGVTTQSFDEALAIKIKDKSASYKESISTILNSWLDKDFNSSSKINVFLEITLVECKEDTIGKILIFIRFLPYIKKRLESLSYWNNHLD